ncbi:hypothetical protein ACFL27_20015 [candidate division CSSED10-310 bacterium]|uniref:Uncharacterized protein n=1 Tax=candidate division CSSED10-310 bacterium TaxID=2855610 RepID=A0ABV6Z207_UNCC1
MTDRLNSNFDIRSLLVSILWILTFHSVLIGISLLIIPPSHLGFFGYQDYQGRFFIMQGGVFHLVMSVIYMLPAFRFERYQYLIPIILIAKGIATTFLILYYICIEPVWMILVSGIGDGVMFAAVFFVSQWSQKGR